MENKSRLFIYLILPLFFLQRAQSYVSSINYGNHDLHSEMIMDEAYYPDGTYTKRTHLKSYNGVVNFPNILNKAQPDQLINNYGHSIPIDPNDAKARGLEIFSTLASMPDRTEYSVPNAQEKAFIKKVFVENVIGGKDGYGFSTQSFDSAAAAEDASSKVIGNELSTEQKVERLNDASQKGWLYTKDSLSDEYVSKFSGKKLGAPSDAAKAVERISKAYKNGWDYTKHSFSQVQEYSEKKNSAEKVEQLDKASKNGWRYIGNSLSQKEIAKFNERRSDKIVKSFQEESLRSSSLTDEQKKSLRERSGDSQKTQSNINQNVDKKMLYSQQDARKKRVSCLMKNVVSPSVYYIPDRSNFSSYQEFKKVVKMQGTGSFGDGWVLRYNGKKERLPNGCKTAIGAAGTCLLPFISVAADRSIYSLGDIISIPELKGRVIRLPSGEQFEHPGYFIVDDVGSAIKGANRFDFFMGSMSPKDKNNVFGYANSKQMDNLLMTDKSKCMYSFNEVTNPELKENISIQLSRIRMNHEPLHALALPDDLINEHGEIK